MEEDTILVNECHAKSRKQKGDTDTFWILEVFGHIIHIFRDIKLKFAEKYNAIQ